MSTRGSIFYHSDKETKVEIHIYLEASSIAQNDIRLEIEHPYGVTNVAWPHAAFLKKLAESPEKDHA